MQSFKTMFVLAGLLSCVSLQAQSPPYDVFPEAKPPYYRVRYEAGNAPFALQIAVNYTVWIPSNVEQLRGIVVHQHGCGEGSCSSGLTGAFDLHWQALAQKHQCALFSAAYEQPQEVNCQLWCDPRNGSDTRFQVALKDLGTASGHPELAEVPWALWGHSGGGHWAGGMTLLHPERVAAAWLRSGVPFLEANPDRPDIKAHRLDESALQVPIMCNLGTKEGVTVKDGRFARVWPANEKFFHALRRRGGLIALAIDPLTAHECGNQRYLAIPWLDACLEARLPNRGESKLRPMPSDQVWLAELMSKQAQPLEQYSGDVLEANWLPNKRIATAWMQFVTDTKVEDPTPPPAPRDLRVTNTKLTWRADADLESGLAYFEIYRDGKFLTRFPKQQKNRFGRPIFQNLLYSDTPTQPLVEMRFVDEKATEDVRHSYSVVAVNTVALKSEKSPEVMSAP